MHLRIIIDDRGNGFEVATVIVRLRMRPIAGFADSRASRLRVAASIDQGRWDGLRTINTCLRAPAKRPDRRPYFRMERFGPYHDRYDILALRLALCDNTLLRRDSRVGARLFPDWRLLVADQR
jgi:hypothetical protein